MIGTDADMNVRWIAQEVGMSTSGISGFRSVHHSHIRDHPTRNFYLVIRLYKLVLFGERQYNRVIKWDYGDQRMRRAKRWYPGERYPTFMTRRCWIKAYELCY